MKKANFGVLSRRKRKSFQGPFSKKSGLARPKGLLQRKNYFLLIHFGCHSLGQKKKVFPELKMKIHLGEKNFFCIKFERKRLSDSFCLIDVLNSHKTILGDKTETFAKADKSLELRVELFSSSNKTFSTQLRGSTEKFFWKEFLVSIFDFSSYLWCKHSGPPHIYEYPDKGRQILCYPREHHKTADCHT